MSYIDTHQKTPEWLAFRAWMDINSPGWAGGMGNYWNEAGTRYIESQWVAFLAGASWRERAAHSGEEGGK